MESALMRVPDATAAVAWCTEKFGRDGERFHTASDFEFGDPDDALFADRRAGPALTSAVAEAFRQGVIGYAHDVVVQGRPWPFDPGRIAAPMEVVHGELDRTVPLAHSRHTSALIPGPRSASCPGTRTGRSCTNCQRCIEDGACDEWCVTSRIYSSLPPGCCDVVVRRAPLQWGNGPGREIGID